MRSGLHGGGSDVNRFSVVALPPETATLKAGNYRRQKPRAGRH